MNHAPVFRTALPLDQTLGHQAVDQSGYPWSQLYHAAGDFQRWETPLAASLEDVQHAVLLQRHVSAIHDVPKPASDHIRCAE